MWRNIEGGIDKEASFAVSIFDRVVDYLGEKAPDRFLGGERQLIPVKPVPRRAIEIAVERSRIEGLLIAEGVVKTLRIQTH